MLGGTKKPMSTLITVLIGLISSEGAGARTLDLRIKSPLLYQLSYALDPLAKCRFSWLREGNKMPD